MNRKFDRITIAVEAGELSRWVIALASMIEQRIGGQVNIRTLGPDQNQPSRGAVDTLLSLERLVLQRNRTSWVDRVGPDDVDDRFRNTDWDAADLLIDLTCDGIVSSNHPAMRPLFNGLAGETGLISALFFESTPLIEIGNDNGVVVSGTASLEAAAGLAGAMEAVWSRAAILICQSIERLEQQDGALALAAWPGRRHARPVRSVDSARRMFRMALSMAAKRAYRLCCHAPHWRVGWRHVDDGDDVWSRRNLGGIRWNVLSDPGDHFYADPFPISYQGRDYLFFEDLDHKTGKGVISFVTFDQSGRPGPVEMVIEEKWHLSYPHLIERDGQIWMIPEASLSGRITIYRAVDFPRRWEPHDVLVSGVEAADATVVEHNGKLWMFAVVREAIGGYSDTLAIWMADRLLGPWVPLAGNPVLIDDRSARPAGNFVKRGGQLFRPVQDCRAAYGAALGLARVDRLDENRFQQVVETYLGPGAEWPGRRLHSLNRSGRLEAIDGSVLRPRFSPAASATEWFYKT